MKISPDIKSLFEDDTKKLTEAFLTGEISAAKEPEKHLSFYFTTAEIERLSSDVVSFIIEQKLLSPVISILGTMKWLSTGEAMIYSRKSRNTLLELMRSGKIYGTKPEGSGDWIWNRESIDRYYEADREKIRLRLQAFKRRAS